MRKDLLSITELAKLRRTTSETLRHYDRINLLKPYYIDPETGYRYYSIRQYEKLGTILELRQLGMSLPEIQNYFADRNLKKSINILTDFQKKVEKQLKELEMNNEILKRKLEFLDGVTKLPESNTIIPIYFPERYMITFGEKAGGPREHAYAYTRLEQHLNEVAPILASDRIGVYADESILEKSTKPIKAIPMIFIEKKDFESEYMRTIPAGYYLCMYYNNGRLEMYHESFEILKDYMKEHDYEICGPIFQIYKIDVTITNNYMETVLEIQVPVKKSTNKRSLRYQMLN